MKKIHKNWRPVLKRLAVDQYVVFPQQNTNRGIYTNFLTGNKWNKMSMYLKIKNKDLVDKLEEMCREGQRVSWDLIQEAFYTKNNKTIKERSL